MKIVILLVTCAIFIDVSCTDLFLEEWELFKLKYNKEYRTDVEDNFRRKVYKENKDKITEHNQLYEKGKVSYSLGINQFADMEHEEFMKTMMGGNTWNIFQVNFEENKNSTKFIPPVNKIVPYMVDWRKHGAVTGVKDQGYCGSSWAFSASGVLEGQWSIKHRKLIPLSEQNLMDCSTSFGNNGCKFGTPWNSFEYIQESGGVDPESTYPYEAKIGTCRNDWKSYAATVRGYKFVEEYNETALMIAVATEGPISVLIDASHYNFINYKHGIHYHHDCKKVYPNHAVLIVGYGRFPNGEDYWLVKNSWGESWGMSGYILMARNKNNNCGIASYATYPVV